MKEGYEGNSMQEGERLVPEDAIVYINTTAWRIYYSPSRNKIYFTVQSYHPGDLELSLEDIEKMFMLLLKNKR